ncbi:hypothetical protein N7493_007390 [Penicillium malachiteum]|uniref:F-box domain-containing protein n=1 Tax=Penicillium malachiteum TaxID=1324776 RepID=A0AAD6HJ48_9EURO|nr:hypothetical protein N7493_007390 [Penicillium malachiteum]
MTGLGIIRDPNLYAPLDKDLSYIDVGTNVLEEWGLCEPSESRWCFGFHNSCWRLLLLRLGHGYDDCLHNETVIAESVSSQLYCNPCLYASSFAFRHDYEGTAQTHKYFRRPKAVDLSSAFYADPCAIPLMHSSIATSPRVGAPMTAATVSGIDYDNESGSCESSPFGSNSDQHPIPFPDNMIEERRQPQGRIKHDLFDALSSELKYEIPSYLSFDELLNMRLVCRNLALLATLDRLPQSYWRSRFLLGQEADFLFPTLTDKLDWFRPFF